MTKAPEYIDTKCPDCGAEVRWYGGDEYQPLVHDSSCPQPALAPMDRMYTIRLGPTVEVKGA